MPDEAPNPYWLGLDRQVTMAETYSTYEVKAKFSEILRKVRAGQSVVIAYRGEEIAEIRPIATNVNPIERPLKRLEEQGLLSGPRIPTGPLKPLAKRPGALARFLASRK
jgi:prevent-host-death family protein